MEFIGWIIGAVLVLVLLVVPVIRFIVGLFVGGVELAQDAAEAVGERRAARDVSNPDTPLERLVAIADREGRTDDALRQQIREHPNVSPALAAWLDEFAVVAQSRDPRRWLDHPSPPVG